MAGEDEFTAFPLNGCAKVITSIVLLSKHQFKLHIATMIEGLTAGSGDTRSVVQGAYFGVFSGIISIESLSTCTFILL